METAWKYVYGMLLWIDPTIGLAHCYESDKCQPGRRWYARSLAFHKWLADEFGTTPVDLSHKLDWLFEIVLEDCLKDLQATRAVDQRRGEQQRALFDGHEFPPPGTDVEARGILSEALVPYVVHLPPPEALDRISARLREYWNLENKRKNLLGEGFEDVLGAIIAKVADGNLLARTRTSVSGVTGFYAPGLKDKATKVDLVIESPGWRRPALVNVKWSIRADREDQLWDDFKQYVHFDRDRRGFDHYLVTNEFDPARLLAVCEAREANSHVFQNVVHINTDGILAAYGPAEAGLKQRGKGGEAASSSVERVRELVKEGRLISLSTWLGKLVDRTA